MRIILIILCLCFLYVNCCKKDCKNTINNNMKNSVEICDNSIEMSKSIRFYIDDINKHYPKQKIIKSYSITINKDSNYSYCYTLNLLSNSKFSFYVITNYKSSDFENIHFISQGTYSSKKGEIVCIDDLFGYNLSFRSEKYESAIIATNIFSNLTNLKLKLSQHNDEYDYSFINGLNISGIRQINLTYNDKFNKLYYGKYGSIELIKPNIYEYNDNVVFSKGTFKYNERLNELELFDPLLNSIWKLYFIKCKKLIDVQGLIYFHNSVSAKEKENYFIEGLKLLLVRLKLI